MSANSNPQRAFRDALGSFATGVTIATTTDAEGNPVGVTASSFNSVSMEPPLVLWSLAKSSLSRDAFSRSGHFAVHVLTASQEELSNRFARSGADKFGSVKWTRGQLGSPLLDEYAALFECQTRHQYEAGDHIILVGEVIKFEARNKAPLLFHGGRYAERRPRPDNEIAHSVTTEPVPPGNDCLYHLIARSNSQTSGLIIAKFIETGLSREEYLVLTLLSMEAPLDEETLASRQAHIGQLADISLLDNMTTKGYIEHGPEGYSLAEGGRILVDEILAAGKILEAELAHHFTHAELAEAKRLLGRVIKLTSSDMSEHETGSD